MTNWSIDDPRAIDAAAATLLTGTPVVVPTDTVYGLAARATDHDAVTTIFSWKGRPDDHPLPVLVANLTQATGLGRFDPPAQALAAAFWPGPLTLVVTQQPELDLALGADVDTVGIRWPAAAFVTALIEQVGPLAATSANRHGRPTPRTAAAVRAELDQADAQVFDGGRLAGQPSTVVDASGPDPQILRVGPISASEIRAVARG